MIDASPPVTVLHVDDDPAFVELTAMYLEHVDDRLHLCSEHSVDDAMERLAEGGVDCILSDYAMPERDGLEFLEAVRARDPDVPFVLFTSAPSDSVAEPAIEAGANDYYRKSMGMEQYTVIANRIVEATAKRRLEDLVRVLEESLSDLVATVDRLQIDGADTPWWESWVDGELPGIDADEARLDPGAYGTRQRS